jgi:hypothetical protein
VDPNLLSQLGQILSATTIATLRDIPNTGAGRFGGPAWSISTLPKDANALGVLYNQLKSASDEILVKVTDQSTPALTVTQLTAVSIPIQDSLDAITNLPVQQQASISVDGALNFGDIEVGTSSTKSFKITNTGQANLEISSYTITQDPVFLTYNWPQIDPTNPLIIPPGSSQSLSITYTPSSTNRSSITIKFFANNSIGGTDTIQIIGTGKDAGEESPLGKKKTGSSRYFVLKNIREVYTQTKNNPDINSPYFDSRTTKHSARIVADIWQCFTKPGATSTTTSQIMEGVVIAKGVGSFWYEDCDEFIGGLLPAYQYFYDSSKINDIRDWVKLDPSSIAISSNDSGLTLQNSQNVPTVDQLRRSRNIILAIAEEIENGTSFWGEFDKNNQNASSCNKFSGTGSYLSAVLNANFERKSSIKIYDGRSDQKQTRSLSITDPNKPDLVTAISGNPEKTLSLAYISKKAYGRLSCLSPKSGCYVIDETPLGIREVGETIIRLATNGRSSLPEQIPSDPCYRGYKTKYIRGRICERQWLVNLNCLGAIFPEYEWRPADELFEQRGESFEVWEDVEFAGTEIGFNDVCNPKELAKEQEPYIDASDIRGCYELHTVKIFHKYPDYQMPGMEDFIKGPEVLSTIDYSGLAEKLGPGVKLSKKIPRADCIDTPIRVYHPLIKGKDIMPAKDILITKGLFNYTQSLLSYSTSSIQPLSSKKYYYDVVDETRIVNGNPVSYFSVAYGNKYGLGSLYEGYELNDSPSRAIYGQYRLLALESPENEFKFYNTASYSSGRKDIYVISFNRDSLTDRIDPGNFEISLSGSNEILTLIDNSKDILEDKFSNEYVYSSFDIVSGSLSNGIEPSGIGNAVTNNTFTTYGKVYPNLGFIVLDAEKLDNEIGLGTNLGDNVDGNNSHKLFTAISGAANIGLPMKVRSSKNKKTNHYFVRVGASTSNYTNNPTIVDEQISGSRYIQNEYFKYRPTTYITTVGLYDDSNELLAVAKISKPILKTPDKDILIKIRLNW